MIIEKNISLKPFNSFGIDVQASTVYKVSTEEDLLEALTIINPQTTNDIMVLGGGSNILLTGDIKIPIIKNELKGISVIEENVDHAIVKSGAGELWQDLVIFALDNDLGGLENLSLIPGSVGASPMQNIGAYGVELKDSFISPSKFSRLNVPKRI